MPHMQWDTGWQHSKFNKPLFIQVACVRLASCAQREDTEG